MKRSTDPDGQASQGTAPSAQGETRRRFVQAIGMGAAFTLAGCMGDDGDGGDGGSDGSAADDGGSDGTTGGSGGSDGSDSGSGGDGSSSGNGDEFDLGESYENPNGIVATVHGIEFTDTIEYEAQRGGTRSQTAEEGMQWAIVDFEATNESGGTEYLPPEFTVNLFANGEEYSSVALDAEGGMYTAGEVADGESSRGRLVYEVPDSVSREDVYVEYTNDRSDADWAAQWRVS